MQHAGEFQGEPSGDGLRERRLGCIVIPLPVSAIVPTSHRRDSLERTLASLEQQRLLPAELIVIDASQDTDTRDMLRGFAGRLGYTVSLRWIAATSVGAAAQRNQGIAESTQPNVWFFDDDILFEPECVERLWRAFDENSGLGGASAMISNQHYGSPGLVSRWMFRLMAGYARESYAGKVIGPAVNLLPEQRDDLPEAVPVEWLNLGCTMYRRAALPSPPFGGRFTGYSLMEDLALSLEVGKSWKLANVRTARIFHDSQPGSHKSDVAAIAEMELLNRYYVMTEVLGRARPSDYLRLLVFELFGLASGARNALFGSRVWLEIRGKLRAARRLLRGQ